MSGELLLPGGVLCLSAQAARRLVAEGNGDAALLYLQVLSRGGRYEPTAAAKALNWGSERSAAAFEKLLQLGLITADAQDSPPARPEPTEPPEYSSGDIAAELESSASFRGLTEAVQQRLGKVLSTADLKVLYTLYDYLALPAEVILLLVNWCAEDMVRKYGPGRSPRMSQIRKEAFVWHRLGIDTVQAAEEHLKKQAAFRDRESSLLGLVGITGRTAVEGERKYLSAWLDMGFDEEAIREAYERTVLKKQAMNWPYMNSILRPWHQRGLHTGEPTRAGAGARGRTRQPQSAAGGAAPAPSRREQEDIAWMKRFLEQERKQEEGG